MLKALNHLINHFYNYIFSIYKTGLKRHFNHKRGNGTTICCRAAKVFPAWADIRDICSQRGNHYDEPPHNLAWHFYLLCSVLGIGVFPVLTGLPGSRVNAWGCPHHFSPRPSQGLLTASVFWGKRREIFRDGCVVYDGRLAGCLHHADAVRPQRRYPTKRAHLRPFFFVR